MSNVFAPARLPGSRRNEVRNLARNHPDFKRWRAINDPNNTMLVPLIIKAINDLGLVDEAEAIMAKPQSAADVEADLTPDHEDTALDTAIDEADMHKSDDEESSEESGVHPIEADIERVLGPIKPFLASGLVDTIEAALRPIVVQAHKPATIVQAPAPVVLKAGETPHAARIGQTTMARAFMVGGAKGKRTVALWNDPYAPKRDPHYVMDSTAMYLAASAFEAGETCWFFGPAGAGKTTKAREYAAITGRGFVRLGFADGLEMIDLIGQPEPQPANESGGVKMVWRDGAFTRAIRRPGTVILLDELTGAAPGTTMTFQTILDEKSLTLPTGEVVNFADGVVVCIADNTAGYGDESGVYAGTQSANGALVDRAVRMIEVNYLPVLLEAEALERRTGAPQPCCLRLAEFAAKTRTVQAMNGSDSRPFSIRRLTAFANATHRDLLSLDEAWQITTLSRLPDADRAAMKAAIDAHFDGKAYARELKGEAAPIEPVQTSFGVDLDAQRQDAAKRAFGAVNQA
jgi:MoxR-like ATPase